MQELKAAKVKEKNNLKVKSLATLVAYLSPLTNFFNFNLSFLILLDIISNNSPISFL